MPSLYSNAPFPFSQSLPVLIYNTMKNQENKSHSDIVSENEQPVDTDRKTFIDVAASVDEYLKRVDWRVSANANQGYSLGGLILNVSGKVIANYWLDQVYAREIAEAHRAGDVHIHDLDMLCGYCAGWSLRTLLAEGFNGIPGKIEAKPPIHLSSAIGQMVNFLGTLQNEWAGAQAFSSTDSYLAPFVRKDNLSFKSVKQCIQELIYNLNVPSRWGCVPLDTEILTKSGWKSKKELSISDQVYGFQDGSIIDDEILAINEYDFDGELIALSNHLQELLFTPNHRVLRFGDSDNQETFFVDDAEALFEAKAPFSMPAAGHIARDDSTISDELIQLYALKQELPIHILRQCSERQIKRFIDLYRSGQTKKKHFRLLIEDKQIVDGFQELAALVGYGTQVVEYNTIQGNTSYLITFVKKRFGEIQLTSQKKVPYQGKVWCPTTRSSYWIARRQGSVFITGNSQTPFTNLTFDWVCPEDLRDQVPYLGGEEMPFSYGDLQPEMDMINRAFIEVMTEGDAKGRIFTFPLPTYNMTSDFPWDSPNVDLLFEMTAKYGLPYFCLAEDTAILTDKGIKPIKEITLSDQVMGSDGQYKAIKNSFQTRQQSGIVITLKGGESICCSENHRFPTALGLKRADALTLEDHLISTEGEVEIIELERINQEMNMVDLEVDSQDHLFLLANNVFTHNSNFVNSDMQPNMVRSMCCRLRLDMTELLKRGNGLFGSAEQTGCYDDETEIFTHEGWKLFKDVKETDLALSMDIANCVPEFVNIDSRYEYDYEGELIHFKSLRVDLLVTPNHRMVYKTRHHGVQVKTAEEIQEYKTFDIPNNRPINRTTNEAFFVLPQPPNRFYPAVQIPYTLWAEFMGFYLSKGSCDKAETSDKSKRYRIVIFQTKAEFKKDIERVLDKLPFSYHKWDHGYQLDNQPLCLYLRQFGCHDDKFIPQDLKEQSQAVLEILWQALVKGDGYKRKDSGVETYWTTSSRLAEDIREILIYMGFNSSCKLQKKKDSFINGRLISKEKKKDCFVITKITKSAQSIMAHRTTSVPYKGKVYCLGVKQGTLLVRRKGHINWCGNSLGVVTVNCARLGYLYKGDEAGLFQRLDTLLELGKESLEVKRAVIQEQMDNGLFPFTQRYLGTLRNHFSTLGVNGVNEMIRNFTDDQEDITTEWGISFAIRLLEYIRNRMVLFQAETGHMYNLEATPAEGTTYRFAKEDKKRFPDIIQAGTPERPYYTNSSQLPVGLTDDPFEALALQDELQILYTGGTVLHLYMNERISSAQACKTLVRRVLENYRLPYITVTPTFSICPVHGYLAGEHEFCPICDQEHINQKNNKRKLK